MMTNTNTNTNALLAAARAAESADLCPYGFSAGWIAARVGISTLQASAAIRSLVASGALVKVDLQPGEWARNTYRTA